MPPQDNLVSILESALPALQEGSIVAISSKIVSLCEGRCVPINSTTKEILVAQNASKVLPPTEDNVAHMALTQVDDVLVEAAGIDTSNTDGYYVLLPKSPYASARNIWNYLRKTHKIKKLGVIITDSHSVPERKGAIGLALASYGFIPLRSYRGGEDIFGSKLELSTADLVDGLAAAATVEMGEGSERTPIALITEVKDIDFYQKLIPLRVAKKYMYVSPAQDVYGPLLESHMWQKPSFRKK